MISTHREKAFVEGLGDDVMFGWLGLGGALKVGIELRRGGQPS